MTTNAEKLARIQTQIGGAAKYSLIYGIETASYSLSAWKSLASSLASTAKPDVVYIKVGESGVEWYNKQFAAIRQIFLGVGIGCVGYIFARPGTWQADAAIATRVGKIAGIVLVDAEEQFLNNNAQLYELLGAIRTGLGTGPVILVTGYGDPETAVPGWDFGALGEGRADGYMPQWYFGGWEVYYQHGYQAAIQWGVNQIADEFRKSNLGEDFPIVPLFSVEGLSNNVIAATASYGKLWKVNQCWWEGKEIWVQQREIIKESA